jgi:hypothetical protein
VSLPSNTNTTEGVGGDRAQSVQKCLALCADPECYQDMRVQI